MEDARSCAVRRLCAGRSIPNTPSSTSSSMARSAIPHVLMARDIMLFCQQRDPSRMPNAYPVTNPASAAPPKKQSAQAMPPPTRKAGGLMALRPYAAAKRTLSVADKLLEVNWGLVLLIALIAIAGIAMLYSVAGGHFQPWALRAAGPFHSGPVRAGGGGDDRHPGLDEPGLSRLRRGAAAAGRGGRWWVMSAWARSAGFPSAPIDLQPSELMKIALVLALARFLHGKSMEEVSKPVPLAIGLAMIAHSRRLRVAAAQSGHHPDHHRRWLRAAVPGGAFLVVDRPRPWARSAAAMPLAWQFRAARLSEGAGRDLPGSRRPMRWARAGTSPRPRSPSVPAGVTRQGLPGRHPEPAELPARKADRFHLDQLSARSSALSARWRC